MASTAIIPDPHLFPNSSVHQKSPLVQAYRQKGNSKELTVYSHVFPSLSRLKYLIEHAESFGAIWPTVILHSKVKEIYRPDIKGPISLFLNLSGKSHCKVDGKKTSIDDNHFLVSHDSEAYTLEIENDTPVETFNIHLGNQLIERVYQDYTTPDNLNLNKSPSEPAKPIHFSRRVHRKSSEIKQLIQNVQAAHQENNSLLLEESLAAIARNLLEQEHQLQKKTENLPQVRKSTQIEIGQRLCVAQDYIHANYASELTLAELAEVSCLSKYHFLRLFKAFYQMTPYQYILDLRLSIAKEWLVFTQLGVGEIGIKIGFQNVSSFCRAFHKQMGIWPQGYRDKIMGKAMRVFV